MKNEFSVLKVSGFMLFLSLFAFVSSLFSVRESGSVEFEANILQVGGQDIIDEEKNDLTIEVAGYVLPQTVLEEQYRNQNKVSVKKVSTAAENEEKVKRIKSYLENDIYNDIETAKALQSSAAKIE